MGEGADPVGVQTARAERLPRLRNVDGLRGLCTVCVLVYHCWLYSSPSGERLRFGGYEGVLEILRYGRTLFFVLSGFLLYRAYANATVNGLPMPSTPRYLAGRFLRIVPAYWSALLVVGFVLCIARTDFPTSALGPFTQRPWAFVADALLVQNFLPDLFLTGIGPAWTLAVEVQFYLLLPLLGMAAAGLSRSDPVRGALLPAACLVVLGAGTKLAVAHLVAHGYMDKSSWSGSPYGLTMLSFPFNAEQFGVGMWLAVVHVAASSGRDTRRLGAVTLGSAAALCLAFAPVLATEVPGRIQYVEAPIALVSACLIYLLVVSPADPAWLRPVRRVLDARPVVALGIVSYGIFLYNEPVSLFLRAHGLTYEGWAHFPLNAAMSLCGTVALATLSYKLVERRCLDVKGRVKPRADSRPQHAAAFPGEAAVTRA